MTLRFVGTPAVLSLILVGCAADDATDAQGERPKETALYGDPSYVGPDCSPTMTSVVNEALRWGRISANSAAFAQCIEQAVHGTATWTGQYRRCNNDPFYGADANTQIVSAIEASRSLEDLTVSCNGVEGAPGQPKTFVAWANHKPFENAGPEEFTFNQKWLTGVAGSLNAPLCSTVPPNTPCRFLPYPWPNGDIANRIWHESSHAHGYQHGDTETPAGNATACGYPGDATFDYQANSMPYIIGNCLSAVLDHSNATCGDPALGCSGGALRLVTGVGATTCECVNDPKWNRIGGASGSVVVGGFGTFASNPDTGELLRFEPSTGVWSVVASPAAQFSVTDQGLFAISKADNSIWGFDGSGWARIGPPSWLLVSGGKTLYAVVEDGSLRRYTGTPNQWTKLDSGGRSTYAANDNDVFAISGDRTSVLRYTGAGETWETIGGATSSLTAGGSLLIVTDPQTGDLLRWDGSPNAWTQVGGPAKDIVINRRGAYAVSPAGSSVYKLAPGTSTFVPMAGLGVKAIYAGGDTVVVARDDGDLMVPSNP